MHWLPLLKHKCAGSMLMATFCFVEQFMRALVTKQENKLFFLKGKVWSSRVKTEVRPLFESIGMLWFLLANLLSVTTYYGSIQSNFTTHK